MEENCGIVSNIVGGFYGGVVGSVEESIRGGWEGVGVVENKVRDVEGEASLEE